MTTPSPLRAPLPETLSDSGALGDGGAPPSLLAGREGSSGSQQENLRAIVGGRLKRMKPAEEAPGIHSSDSCAAVASCCAPAAGEAGADDHETCEDPEAIGRNRRSSGRHGDRIPCPMDPSHCIYSLRLQAHLKKHVKEEGRAGKVPASVIFIWWIRKGDLTRWLGCWSAVAVAATAPSAGAKAFEAGSSSVLLSGEAPRHRGIRCIVVDREARRYRKEAKDKLLRNPNEPRRLHPAAVAAAQRRKAAGTAATGASAVDCNSGPNNPLLEEATGWRSTAVMQYEESARSASLHSPTVGGSASDAPPLAAAPLVAAASPDESSGCNTDRSLGSLPFLPFPPVRLRMDISDFSLSALLQYVRAQGPLRQPHVPGFFNTLFRYGCRFALPPHPKVKPAVEAQQQALHNGAGEPKAEKARSEEGSFSGVEGSSQESSLSPCFSASTVAECTTETATAAAAATREASAPPAAGRGLPHGPKSRLLRSLADGSTADFFRLAETLGEGGGPNMKKIEEVLGIHFKGSPVVSVLGVAKHLCGSGSDVALRCFASAKDRGPSDFKFCICIATCCHHRCSMDSFVGVDFLLKLGLSLPEISLLFSLSGSVGGCSFFYIARRPLQ
ncbi:Ubiquitin, related protein, related protein [Cyclospora cayetanensis]|uniref:tRNA:m(4)X modification enzyme TRM13 n=1 Tax=Cyclospora cayetanensis TaxID=88456 RepID=A0A1D3CWS2_9EIME|nr:Ubiquitin, related protein, related protein [Cyclospora cayetanensis]